MAACLPPLMATSITWSNRSINSSICSQSARILIPTLGRVPSPPSSPPPPPSLPGPPNLELLLNKQKPSNFDLKVVFAFLLIDATDRSKISSDKKRVFIALSLYPLSFFANTLFNLMLLFKKNETIAHILNLIWCQCAWKVILKLKM